MTRFVQQNNKAKWLLAALFILAILYLAYIPYQSDFNLIFPVYCSAFIAYLLLVYKMPMSIKLVVRIGILLRVALLFSSPSFSDDIYRYLWDGMLSTEGINPYAFAPSEILNQFPSFIGAHIFPLLNSKDYFTVYPLLAQFLFLLAGLAAYTGLTIQLFIMKGLLIAFDIGTVIILPRLLHKLHLNPFHSFWYILNPLILLELNANAHLEGVMIFFLVSAAYLYTSGKQLRAYIFYLGAIATKIIPLMLFPFIYLRINKKHRLIFIFITGLFTVLLFLPALLSNKSTGILSSLKLYFEHFEFNASIYYIGRFLGQLIYGYNTISTLGPMLAFISAVIILFLSFKTKVKSIRKTGGQLVLIFTTYLLFSTTIHPWYLSTIILLCCFSHFKFPILWSFLVYLSYYNYSGETYYEPIWLVALEYSIVLGFMAYEYIIYKTRIT
jgi:hypothetical protein